jgi:hypothetical protein
VSSSLIVWNAGCVCLEGVGRVYPEPEYRLRLSRYRLRLSRYRLRLSRYRLRLSRYRLRLSRWSLSTASA